MRPVRFAERDHSVANAVTLLAVVCLDLVTWCYLGEAATAAVVIICQRCVGCLFGTCVPDPPASSREYNEVSDWWMDNGRGLFILLGFADIAPALQSYLTIGALVGTAASIPGTSASRSVSPLPTAQLS